MDQLQRLKQAIVAGKVEPDRVHPEWAFQRAWNEALVWVEQQIRIIEGEQK